MASPSFLMAFDFDCTIVEENTDSVVQVLPIPDELKSLAADQGWTAFMKAVFVHLHANGKTKEDYVNVLDKMKFAPKMSECLRALKDLGAELIIISDSNTFFISHILEFHALSGLVREVFTNPAEFDDAGLLCLRPYHENKDCKLSGINLCKGKVLEDYLAKRKEEGVEYKFVGYVGDGTNDFCPMLRLGARDIAFPRRGFSIEKPIKGQEQSIAAEVSFWSTGDDILNAAKKKLQKDGD